ncbi:hypothetical protein P7C73_g951, partial [Tremellales sp. Uapishka_1]
MVSTAWEILPLRLRRPILSLLSDPCLALSSEQPSSPPTPLHDAILPDEASSRAFIRIRKRQMGSGMLTFRVELGRYYPRVVLDFSNGKTRGADSSAHRKLMAMRPTLAVWGIGAGVAVSLFMSSVPIFQTDVLKKIPAVGRGARGVGGDG